MHPYILEKLKIKVEDNVFEIDFDYLTFEGEEDDDMLSSDQTDLLSDQLSELSSDLPNQFKEISDNILDYPKLVETTGKGDTEEAELELF